MREVCCGFTDASIPIRGKNERESSFGSDAPKSRLIQ
ncbi:hypothetical protein RE6C_02195 [Rhodopirellula europaea 6C]|uniref:Uncharacterized protein n=1 Tax=Rhodopirellula europaea 6C TaxID=1263867 RepID=M2B4C1_9BACT|nr:hypothetical protein RE6C_02195 [Rhodopirellula europaea 6C]